MSTVKRRDTALTCHGWTVRKVPKTDYWQVGRLKIEGGIVQSVEWGSENLKEMAAENVAYDVSEVVLGGNPFEKQ